jgi:hypothetical protein
VKKVMRPPVETSKDEFVATVGRPGEVFWQGVVADNWVKVVQGRLRGLDADEAREAAQQLLVLTSERLFILLRPEGVVELSLGAITSARMQHPKRLRFWRRNFAMVELSFYVPDSIRPETAQWMMRTDIARGFIELLLENKGRFLRH